MEVLFVCVTVVGEVFNVVQEQEAMRGRCGALRDDLAWSGLVSIDSLFHAPFECSWS